MSAFRVVRHYVLSFCGPHAALTKINNLTCKPTSSESLGRTDPLSRYARSVAYGSIAPTCRCPNVHVLSTSIGPTFPHTWRCSRRLSVLIRLVSFGILVSEHDTLVAEGGLYRELFDLQASGYIATNTSPSGGTRHQVQRRHCLGEYTVDDMESAAITAIPYRMGWTPTLLGVPRFDGQG